MTVVSFHWNLIYKNRQRLDLAYGPKLADPCSNLIQHSLISCLSAPHPGLLQKRAPITPALPLLPPSPCCCTPVPLLTLLPLPGMRFNSLPLSGRMVLILQGPVWFSTNSPSRSFSYPLFLFSKSRDVCLIVFCVLTMTDTYQESNA